MTIFGKNVKTRRAEIGLTQKSVAEKVGITQAYVAEIEAGRKSATLAVIAGLADILKTTPSNLLSAEMAILSRG